jgi:hypothetical protein
MILGAVGRLICHFDLEDHDLYSLKWYMVPTAIGIAGVGEGGGVMDKEE